MRRKFLYTGLTKTPQIIHLNCDLKLRLPYVHIPEINANFMIDTGSTRSFISPVKAYEYFQPFVKYEPFEVVSTHASSSHNQTVKIPPLPTFKNPESLYHKFYIYDVDSRYDGLIGNDLLKDLEAVIDLKNKILKTRHSEIPIIHNSSNYVIKLPPRTELRVKLPTDIYSGEAILNYKQFCEGVRMPDALVKCVNGYATTVIQNTRDQEMELTITKPFTTNEFSSSDDDSQINFTDDYKTNTDKLLNDSNTDSLLTANLNKLRLDHMNDEERNEITKLCLQYKDIFYCDQLPLTFTNQVKHHIRTKNEDPIYTKPYRQPPAQAAEIERQVEKLMRDDVIQESHSPWSSPVHLVPKKADASGEKKYRMVIDYRRLNEITIDDKYPLPNITDIFDKIGRSTYFSTIDLASGYHQIEVNEADRQKTAFSTQSGHYEFKRMPFGLKTAPATFQRAINNVLRGLQGLHCLVYLDDIIIFSSSLQEHIEKLKKVFDRLRLYNLKVQLDKSEFLRKEVLYLGHTITGEGLKPNNDKIKAVLDYPLPKTQTEIRSFIGLIGYYRRFIKDFAKITHPLTSCLKKGRKVTIDEKYKEAFQKCKELLTTAPLLQYPDQSKPYILTTDASQIAIGAVLSQGPIGQDKPVAYASRALSDSETRYSTIERELLAIIWAVKHFRPYIYGNKFTIYTDHRPLVWLYSLKEPDTKLTRWRLKLQQYDFEIVYKNGKQNTNADALSRIRINALDSDDDNVSMKVNVDQKDEELKRFMQELDNKVEELEKKRKLGIETEVGANSDTSSLMSAILGSNETQKPNYPLPTSSSSSDTIHSCIELESHGIPILHEAVDTKPNQILVFQWNKNEMHVKDLSRKKQKVLEVFLPINNLELIKRFLKEYIKPKTKYFIYFENEQHRKDFSSTVIKLFKKGTVDFMECTERTVFIEDEEEQKAIILKYHNGPTCHRGIKETMLRIRRNYYWDNMSSTVAAVINACESCKRMKYDRKPIKPVLQLTQTQDAPFQELFIDLFTIDSKCYLTVVDAFSKLAQALEISNRSTPEVVRALIKYFSFYGIPRKISCDPGSEFNNELMKELMDMYKIELHITTPNNPNSTAIVERFHSTIIEIYRLAKYEQKYTDAASVMTYSILAYNHTIHSTTSLTPFEVVFGHTDANNAFDADFEKAYVQQLTKDHAKRTKLLYQYIAKETVKKKEKIKDKRGGEQTPELEIGDIIFTKDINTRKSKDKARYKKAIVQGSPDRNVVPVTVGNRVSRIPVKNIKRFPQVQSSHPPRDDTGQHLKD